MAGTDASEGQALWQPGGADEDSTWPEPTLLRDKLYSNLEELKRTAAFVRATGIAI